MGELNFIMQNYLMTGKPEAVQPVKIEYRTNAGKGVINMDLVRFFPASSHDIKVLIDTLWMSANTYETAGIIADYLKKVIADLQQLRSDHAYSEIEKGHNAKFNGYIKKYVSNLDKIAGAFGLESVTDEKMDAAKLHKCVVYAIHSENREKVLKTYNGKYFIKNGVKYKVYKIRNNYFAIIIEGTGIAINYCYKMESAPEYIDEQTERAYINMKKENVFEKAHADFVELCEKNGITAPELSPALLNQEPQTAPALDAEKEPQTKEPEKVQTAEKPARNVIKRSTAHIIARWKVETCAGCVDDLFDIKKTENGWTGENITRKNGKFYTIPIAGLRNAEFVEIVKQETAKEYFAHIMNNIITTEPKPADPTPETVTDRKPGEVWKPCTMTSPAKNGIIYRIIPAHIETAEPPAPELVKALKSPAIIKGCINVYRTAEKPVTGKIQAHNRHIIGTEYTPEPMPGKPPRSLKCYGIVNRRVPRFEIRGSPILHEKKNGGFCWVYIRPPAGVPKSFNLKK